MTNRVLTSTNGTIGFNIATPGYCNIDVSNISYTQVTGLVNSATIDTTNASNITTGLLYTNANNSLFIGGLPAVNVVSNSQLIANLALYAPLASPVLTGTPRSSTQANPYDSTNKIATDAFVQNALLLSMSTVPMTLTNGIYSFATTSTNFPNIHITTTSNSIVTTTVDNGGSGLKPGDIMTPRGGNSDALLRVDTVSGNVAITLDIVYGGTGYHNSTGIASDPSSAIPYTFILTGTLTGNATILATPGTYITGSQQWNFINNTTGPFSVIVSAANSSNLPTSGRTVIIPQGTGSSRLVGVETDSYNVDICSIVNSTDLIPGVTNTSTAATLNIGTWKINTGLVVTNSSGSNVVTFNTSFINPPYSVIVEPVATVYSAIASVNSVSNTGVTINSAVNTGLTNTGIQGVYYTAIGS